jgi:hypothetical protein
LHNTENSRIRADAQRESQNKNRRKTGRLGKNPKRISNILFHEDPIRK